jgi:hypothetical protein
MRRRFAIYPTRAPRSPREPRPGRRGLSEAEVRSALYPSRRDLVTPLGTTVDRVLAALLGRVPYAPEDLAGPWV